ncbi:hypothetical protein Tco_0639232 [Tanacetum coccineum]
MENPEQAFVDYASSRTDEAGGKWYTFKPEQNNLGDTYNPSWKSHPNLRWRQPQNSQNNFSNPPNRFQPNGSNLERLVSNFMASQDARLSKFEANFKQQQSKMTNKIETFLKAVNDQITGALPSERDPNDHPKSKVQSTLSRCVPSNRINLVMTNLKVTVERKTTEEEGKEEKGDLENINTNPPSPPDLYISFVTKKVFKKYDDPLEEELGEDENTVTGGLEIEYFDIFSTRSELAYHKYLMCGLIPSLFLRNSIIIMRRQLEPREDPEGIRGICNFTGRVKGMHIFIGNFTYVLDFMIVKDISSIIDPRLFMNEIDEIAYNIPHKIDQYNSLSDLKKEYTKSVYFRNGEDKRRGVDYVMSKILGFYKECLEVRPEYLTRLEDEGGVT